MCIVLVRYWMLQRQLNSWEPCIIYLWAMASLTNYFYGPTAAFIPINLFVETQLVLPTKINRWTSAITVLLYTCYGTLMTHPKRAIELCKHRAHAPLLLAETLHRGHSTINKRSSFKYRVNYCTIFPMVSIGGFFRYMLIVYCIKFTCKWLETLNWNIEFGKLIFIIK